MTAYSGIRFSFEKTFGKILFCFLFASLLILGSSQPLFCAQIPPEISKALEEGRSATALSLTKKWGKAAKTNEDKAMALWMEARILALYKSDFPEAEEAIVKLIRKYPKTRVYPDARYEEAILAAQQGQKQKAIVLLASFIKTFPEHPRRKSAGLLLTFFKDGDLDFALTRTDQIRILADIRDASLFIKGFGLYIWDENTGKGIYRGDEISLDIDANGRILLNGTPVPKPLHVDQKRDFLTINGKRYRGSLRIDTESGRLQVVNILALEEYLRGVVPAEMPSSWPREALMAQAIAARSFAVYHMGRKRFTIYDLRADTRSQVYSVESENPRTDSAVQATKGKILVWEGSPALTSFHADSGGRTESATHVWGGTYPYLASFPDEWTRNTPNDPWQYTLDQKALLARIPKLRELGGIQDIRTSGKTPSGRVKDVVFKGLRKEIRMPATEFRMLAGAKLVKSTYFSVKKTGSGVFVFEGKGYGHGVGMSQWGAKKMAESGKTHLEILKYYYPYLGIVKVSS